MTSLLLVKSEIVYAHVCVCRYDNYCILRELSFKKGDVLTLTRTVDQNWLEGTLNGKTGIFPNNFVKVGFLSVAFKIRSQPLHRS